MFLTLEESFKWAATKDAQRRAALFKEMKRIEEAVHYQVFSDATYMEVLGIYKKKEGGS